MSRFKRPITPEDLKSKGLPFECQNCGNKPTAQNVISNNGDCEICGDSIVAYTMDTAELLINLSKTNETK